MKRNDISPSFAKKMKTLGSFLPCIQWVGVLVHRLVPRVHLYLQPGQMKKGEAKWHQAIFGLRGAVAQRTLEQMTCWVQFYTILDGSVVKLNFFVNIYLR